MLNELTVNMGENHPPLDETYFKSEKLKDRLVKNTKTAFQIAKILTGGKSNVLLYGGTIRNLLLGIDTSIPDYDFIGDFSLDDVQRNFPDLVLGRWDNVSTMRLKIGSTLYDLTSAKDTKERLAIGDITVSNLCMTEDGVILDYFGGLKSLAKREIKMIDPEVKIAIDPVRILRVFRFAAELGFTIEESTLNAAIKNAHLLQESRNLDDDIWQMISLDNGVRMKVLWLLRQYGIDRYLSYPNNVFETINTLALEKDIGRCSQIDEVARMFNTEVYLVGGAVRDTIWNKRINDFDFKVRLPLSDIIKILEENGYTRVADYHTSEHQYYVSAFSGVVGAVIDGIDVHLAEITTTDIPTLINEGDVNFSCCIFNIHSKRIENPERIREIRDKELRFANPDNAKSDPMIVINALKQISRIPDIVISQETRDVIEVSIPKIVEFVRTHQKFKYKIASFCGNLNSEEVYRFFGAENQDIFEGIDKKRHKLVVTSSQYTSVTTEELSEKDKVEITRLLRGGYGKHFDESKVFAENVNSVVIARKNGRINACCLADGERPYSVAAREGSDWIDIIADLVKNNYNIWCTVDCNNPKIQALCSLAGLTMETNPQVVRKILQTKSDKYKDLKLYEHNGMLVFRKNGQPDDYPQILLRS